MENKIFAGTERFFLALADATRLRLLNLMRGGEEVNVNSFVEIMSESQPKISRHLAFLRGAGIIDLRRDGKWIYYKITEPKNDLAALVLRDVFEWLDAHDDMQRESEEFNRMRGLPERPPTPNDLVNINTFAEANIRSEQRRELEIYLL